MQDDYGKQEKTCLGKRKSAVLQTLRGADSNGVSLTSLDTPLLQIWWIQL